MSEGLYIKLYTSSTYKPSHSNKENPSASSTAHTKTPPYTMMRVPPRERSGWPTQLMKHIRSEQYTETAFSDLPFFRFLKTLCILSLFCFKLSHIKDTNINHSKKCCLGYQTAVHSQAFLGSPPSCQFCLSLHFFSVSWARKTRQYLVCLCVQDESFPLPLLPNADAAAQNTLSR